jgi:hypothetical protein
METFLIIIDVLSILFLMKTSIKNWVQRRFGWAQPGMKKHHAQELFAGRYIDARVFYVQSFQTAPSILFIDDVDCDKASSFIKEGKAGEVMEIFQRNWYNRQQNRQENDRAIFKLENKVIIDLGCDYAQILYPNERSADVNKLLQTFVGFKAEAKEEDYEINIITLTSNGLELKTLQIAPIKLDIDLYYNDDFKAVDTLIKARLGKENDKGIILLHGLPGTGKTTYLRHLIGSTAKRILFVSPGVAGNLMNPEFIDLLIDNPNAVLVIEDAENIIKDRKYSSNSSVSNLLNISDGLLSDCLNVQIICTFNSSLNLVDDALLRKGRLIAKYEFGKLEVTKAQRLSNHLGLNQTIERPLTLAEITHPDTGGKPAPQLNKIGFRRPGELIEN